MKPIAACTCLLLLLLACGESEELGDKDPAENTESEEETQPDTPPTPEFENPFDEQDSGLETDYEITLGG
jgi:hypothetical protein